MSDTNKKLFQDFDSVSRKEWMEKVTIDLKGADFDRKLVWKNMNKINVQPFYTVEDAIENLQNTGENAPTLLNYRRIDTKSAEAANKLALLAIEEGINGLIFEVNDSLAPAELFKNIDLNKVAVVLKAHSDITSFASEFFSFVAHKHVEKDSLKGYFDLNLISEYVTSGRLENNTFETMANVLKLASDYPNYKVVSISGKEYLNAGSNQVQEVAYSLNSLVFVIENLVEKGVEPQTIFDNLNFQFAIGSEYFIEIGKFRAFNHLLKAIAEKYGVSSFSHTLTAQTSVWSKSVTDPHTNLLRATTEAMSAILGNVDGVLIDPFDREFQKPTDFSRRIAGNVATILKEESYLGKVANPVDGSYYIEEVSTKIASKALELFKTIEKQGGFYSCFEKEIIQEQIAEMRQEKIKLLSQRRLVMVGVNKYPNLMETIAVDILSEGGKSGETKVLYPRRATLEIEAIRKETEVLVAKTNKRPVVELASFGNLTMRKARAAFAYDFVGVSGFNVLPEKSYPDAKKAAEESARSNASVVVICSSDQDYEESAVDFVKTFRGLSKDKVLLLAGNPTNIIDELMAAGLDGVIHIKSDVITTISSMQQKIKKSIKSLEV